MVRQQHDVGLKTVVRKNQKNPEINIFEGVMVLFVLAFFPKTVLYDKSRTMAMHFNIEIQAARGYKMGKISNHITVWIPTNPLF